MRSVFSVEFLSHVGEFCRGGWQEVEPEAAARDLITARMF